MHYTLFVHRFAFCLLLTPVLFSPAQAQQKITVNLQQKGATISPSMYGVFFEEINHAGDGGLYAELVQNRSFEEGQIPDGFHVEGNILVPTPVKNHLTGEVNKIADSKMRWNKAVVRGWALDSSSMKMASMKLTSDHPYFETAKRNLEVTIQEAGHGVALVNEGYWGMKLEAGGKYYLRTIVRAADDYKGTIRVSLLSSTGKVLASCPVQLTKRGEWNDVRATLTATSGDPKARLTVQFDAPGTVWLDYVSLMPAATFSNRPNGLRKDIAQTIADLKPAFLRWPGGTIVGGITLDTRFKWKQTLGDPAARPGEYFTWGYRCSYGLGYYEMLQYCEDIGTDMMFVCNVGLGDQYRMGDASPADQVDLYIQDCFDAIEYALGDATTTWGARRAASGHPAPFRLKYVEVGNEHWGKEYDRRFSLFYTAIKNRYPQLQVIYNAMLSKKDTAEAVKTDIIDPHFYETTKGFYKKNNLFDNYPRDAYKVYIGEYACNSGVGSGNMAAALSEAAFIDGLERNGDLITMTSFAPLLENTNDRRWPVNLIRFNSEKVVGRSSYYVQKMASRNRPTYNVSNDFRQGKTDSIPLQFLSSGYDEPNGELVLKFVNGSGNAYPATLQLKGTTKVQQSGKITTLSATSDKDENTMEEPQKVYPKESVFNGFGSDFSYRFPPFSYTVLRIKVK